MYKLYPHWLHSPRGGGGGGGGAPLIFSSYVGTHPASIVHPTKYQEFQAPPKIFEILPTPKIPPIQYLDFKKRPLKCIEMTPCQF